MMEQRLPCQFTLNKEVNQKQQEKINYFIIK